MQKTLFLGLLLLTVGLSSASGEERRRGWGIRQSCAKYGFTRTCLAGLFLYRCAKYSFNPRLLYQCERVATQTAVSLDAQLSSAQTPEEFVAFASELRILMRTPAVHRYLSELLAAFQIAGQQRAPFDLWAFTFAATGNEVAKTLQWLAVLFQDTSASKAPIIYLIEKRDPQIPRQAIEDLSDLLALLKPSQLMEERYSEWLKLYPTCRSTKDFNAAVYHFYPIAYLAFRVYHATEDARMAFFMPFLMSSSYKFQSLEPEHWPHQDPKRISVAEHRWELQDLYMGYLAAVWATDAQRPVLSFEAFSQEMAEAPYEFMQKVYLRRR